MFHSPISAVTGPILELVTTAYNRRFGLEWKRVSLCDMALPLHAPLEISFDYTRSLGPTLSRFMTGLAQRRIIGSRDSTGRVHAPPIEYDPVTHAPSADFVEVSTTG